MENRQVFLLPLWEIQMSKNSNRFSDENDEKELLRIEKMFERKDKNSLGNWLRRWNREGRFWEKDDRRDDKFQSKADNF